MEYRLGPARLGLWCLAFLNFLMHYPQQLGCVIAILVREVQGVIPDPPRSSLFPTRKEKIKKDTDRERTPSRSSTTVTNESSQHLLRLLRHEDNRLGTGIYDFVSTILPRILEKTQKWHIQSGRTTLAIEDNY